MSSGRTTTTLWVDKMERVNRIAYDLRSGSSVIGGGMSTALSEDIEVVTPEGRTSTVLRATRSGRPLCSSASHSAAPMTALLFNVPVIVSGSGWAAPAAFIVATVMLSDLHRRLHRDDLSGRRAPEVSTRSSPSVSDGPGAGHGGGGQLLVCAPRRDHRRVRLLREHDDRSCRHQHSVWLLMFGVIGVDLLFAWFDISSQLGSLACSSSPRCSAR